MRTINNPYFPNGLDHISLKDMPLPSVSSSKALELMSSALPTGVTPLVDATELAARLGVSKLWVKDERPRMGLGSFKALGAAYVIACDHDRGEAEGQTYIAASAGNHGISVSHGAAKFNATARIYLSETVPEVFADRLRGLGAEVVRAGATYEESMEAAAQAAETEGAVLLSDSSWPGYFERPHRLMEGYTVLMAEVFDQIPEPPTHILLQAGVGGLAAAAAAMARKEWGSNVEIVVVEPDAAPALQASIEAGEPVVSEGPVSIMGRLDCKEPSLIALKGLSRDANHFMTISESQGEAGRELAAQHGLASTASGAAGIAALALLDLPADARVLTILSEEPE